MRRRGDIPGAAWLIITYVLFALSGILALTGSSPVLLREGGHAIAVAWGVCCVTGAVIGVGGTLSRRVAIALIGQSLGATASLTWAVALIMQAVATHSRSPLTAACLALASVLLIVQRWVDAVRDLRERGEG